MKSSIAGARRETKRGNLSYSYLGCFGCRREGGNLSATGEWRVEREEKTYQMKINVSNLTVGRLLVSCI